MAKAQDQAAMGLGIGQGLNNPPEPERLRLVQDDSCHWYAIPAGFQQEFDAWVQSFEDSGDAPEYEGPDFDDYRIDGHPSFYTFTGLERE